MEEVACSKCEWVGKVEAHTDTCPHCRKRGTLTAYASVAWALTGNTVTPSPNA
jgi:RNA polymerase subunit RPABC4/transcription elongation factor Spt4